VILPDGVMAPASPRPSELGSTRGTTVKRSRRTPGTPRVWLLALGLVLAACGGHSSDSTGPSSSSTSTTTVDFGQNNPRTVDAFGDSITFGTLELRKKGFNLDTSNNYPNNLQALLQKLDPAWRVNNRGVGGEHVEQGSARIDDVLHADRPGYVLIMEGTNNATICDDATFIVEHLRIMVDSAKANKTIPVIGTIPPNFRNNDCAHDVIDQANTLIHGLAAAEGIQVAEIFNGMNSRGLFGLSPDQDPLHPNEAGYAVMANIWFNALKQVIPGGGTAVALHRKR
jgi:lysophospholipase L1-like esterase